MIGSKSESLDFRCITFDEAKETADTLEIIYIEVSAKLNNSIHSTIEQITKEIYHKKQGPRFKQVINKMPKGLLKVIAIGDSATGKTTFLTR